MFRAFKEISDSLRRLETGVERASTVLSEALQNQAGVDHLEARLAELEATLTKREAAAEALRIEAESKFKAARAAEERSRHAQKRTEEALSMASDGEGEEEIPQEWLDLLRSSNGGGSQEEGVQPVRAHVETPSDTVARLRALKFGY